MPLGHKLSFPFKNKWWTDSTHHIQKHTENPHQVRHHAKEHLSKLLVFLRQCIRVNNDSHFLVQSGLASNNSFSPFSTKNSISVSDFWLNSWCVRQKTRNTSFREINVSVIHVESSIDTNFGYLSNYQNFGGIYYWQNLKFVKENQSQHKFNIPITI